MGLFESLFRTKPQAPCEVEIHDVRPLEAGEFEPYFAAICACGWVEIGDSEADARRKAADHDSDVVEELRRPLG